MIWLRRLRGLSAWLAKAVLVVIVCLLVLLGLGIGVAETSWGKNRIRDLLVAQANNYLTATLSIGRLEGSLLRGIQLGDVTVARGGQTLIRIDEIAFSYSIRELTQSGVVIKSVRLTRPIVVGARTPEGGWDLAALVKRDSREGQRTGPGRPIQVLSIEVIDGHVTLRNPLDFGAAHVPTDFEHLNASFSFAYYPVHWTLTFARASFIGHAPDLTVDPLSGAFGRGSNGWFFEDLAVRTPRSAFRLDGTANNVATPTELNLQVRAERFAFQEWSGVLRGLKNIAVDAAFDTSLKGPLTQLQTDLRFTGTGGAVKGRVTLDTTVPGWHGAGAFDVERINLAHWLNRPERPSDITGHVTFDLALEFGRHFPRGVFAFTGPHVMYMNYAGDNLRTHGQLTESDVLIARADSVAYGADVSTVNASIGLDEPFPFHFPGTTAGIDLRQLPEAVPVPHVESRLTFDYDVTGRFSDPFIAGRATFAASEFLGAAVGAGTVGSIDTSQRPIHYTGDGEVDGISLRRFGDGLDVEWMRAPKYAGALSGRFHVDGYGADRATLALTGGGRLARADLFQGTLSDADVSIDIADGTLRASYDGRFAKVDPAIAFEDPQLESTLTGSGRVAVTVHDLLARAVTVSDYDVEGALTLGPSTVREIALDAGKIEATLRGSQLNVARLDVTGAAIAGNGSGLVGFAEGASTDFQYDLAHVDLERLRAITGIEAAGALTTKGRVTGPAAALHAVGDATLNQLAAFDATAVTLAGHYDVTVPSGDIARATATATGHGSLLTVAGQSLEEASGTVGFTDGRLRFDLQLTQTSARHGTLAGELLLHPDQRSADLIDLKVALGNAPWHLVTREPAASISWNDQGIVIAPVAFVDANNDERLGVSGSWRSDGAGALHVTAQHVFLDTMQSAFQRPTLFGGVLDLDATIAGTRAAPRVNATVTVTNGRVERVSYQTLSGRVGYAARMFDLDLRLDQSPGVWLTAKGSVPLALFNPDLPEQPLDVAITSSTVSLGLIEGVTDVVREVAGEITVNVKAIGTSRDPHLSGSVAIANAAFLVTTTGSRYRNARAAITLASDKITVDSLHVEDTAGRPLDVHGSLGTHELRVGALEIEGTASRFEVMHNELGRINLDAKLQLRGQFEAPRLAGDLTITSGSSVRVDEILQRALFQPYATEAAGTTQVDAMRALNPWERLGLDLSLHVPDTLRLTGDNVQISQGTPIGLGDINLRVIGDLYLYKDPEQPLSVTGSFDSLNGTYAFQGRRFDIDPTSSINFRGDLNPELYVTVTRLIAAVQTRVSIFGTLREPELRLASTPPLDQSDILSLILFNTSTNGLSPTQQQQLLVRAGALAAGFLASPILSAIENEIGLSILEIDPTGDNGTAPRITIGDEILPGLVARFSRQFGSEAETYDEATLEYQLSRILRLRASYSDAQPLTGLASFRRIERTGIDLLFFFSF